MSCLRFIGGPVSDGGGPPLRFVGPRMTASKVHRLHKLASSGKVKDRVAAAGNPMTDSLDLWYLSWDASIEVRSWVLRNPNVPIWILRERLGYPGENESMKEKEESLIAFALWRLGMLKL